MYPSILGFDGLQNLITGLGTDKDKIFRGNQHRYIPYSYGQLQAAYRGSWTHRKVVDIPADDATRNWRQWQGEPAQVKAVEALEEKLQLRSRVNESIRLGRLYGGCALILVFDDGIEPVEPLEKVDQGTLIYVRPLESVYLHAHDIYDITVGPEWFRMATGTPIHVSRMARIIPRRIPDTYNREEWGDSVLQTCMMEADNLLSVEQSLAYLIAESKVDIVKIKGFMDMLSNEQFTKNLTQRFMMINQLKSMVNAHILDSEDSWERQSTATELTAVPGCADTFMKLMAAAADIPMTRFVAQSPAGLNATGDSDLRNYADSIKADQENLYRDALLPVDRALVHSALGEWPAGLTYEWNPLWIERPAEKSERAKAYSDIFMSDVTSGIFENDELRAMRIAQLMELDLYPNIEAATGTEEDIEEDVNEDDESVRNTFNERKNIPRFDPSFGDPQRRQRRMI